MEPLSRVFDLVCGRVHCWAPGGATMPLCQRCTGLYVGAAVAMVLYAAFRPRPTPLVLWCHGLMLLAMVPFGYHLVPQDGAVRTLTGQLFGVGLVGYLSLVPLGSLGAWSDHGRGRPRAYALGVLASVALLQGAVRVPLAAAGEVLAWLALAGLAGLAALVAANLVLLPPAAWRAVRPGHRGAAVLDDLDSLRPRSR